jgi:hypothetical protein
MRDAQNALQDLASFETSTTSTVTCPERSYSTPPKSVPKARAVEFYCGNWNVAPLWPLRFSITRPCEFVTVVMSFCKM